ncbi:MAG: aminodeoxychorismate/anthranilate synthase component II [bacterium]|nr:aminodeoxychorismate/anthranilate synthase component II [bacterium]
MKIAVINNFDSFVFNLVRYLKEAGCDVLVQRNDQVDFETLDSCDGILLSPGPGIPSEAGALMDVIAHFVNKKPILGVCLGHQALAEYFGGSLSLAPAPMHGKSSKILKTESSRLFNNVPAEFEVGRYHSWIADAPLPDSLKVTALFKNEIMAFEHNELPLFGVQFHPESILTPDGRTMILNYLTVVKQSIPVTI